MKQLIIFFLLSAFSTALIISCGDEQAIEQADSESEEVVEDISEVPELTIQGSDEYVLTPADPRIPQDSTPDHLDLETVRAFTFVQLSDSIAAMREYESGKILEFSLDENLSISARVNRNQAVGQRIRNLTASILAPHEGVVTLSIDLESVSGNIDLISENRLFHIRFDSLSGRHYLAEIDRAKLDVMEGSEPLEID